MPFDYRTTIHTMEIRASTELSYPDFMDVCNGLDCVSEVRRSGSQYAFIINPHKANGIDDGGLYAFRYLPLSEHLQILENVRSAIRADSLTITRLDLCCDPQIDYKPSEKLLRLLVLLLASKIESRNRYLSIDPMTLEIKTIRIDARKGYNGKCYNSELQIEHYNRALLDQSNWDSTVINRLEFRASGTEAGENYSIEEIIDRWKSRLQAVSSPLALSANMQAVENALNAVLYAQWRQLTRQVDTPTGKLFNDFVFFNLEHIYTRRQMLELFRLYGDTERQALDRNKNIRRERRKAFRGQLLTEKQLAEEVESLIQSIENFIQK